MLLFVCPINDWPAARHRKSQEIDMRQVTGRWSEVCLREGGEWVMIPVSGGSDSDR